MSSGFTVSDPVARHRAARPGARACVELATGRSVTYGELDERVGRAAGWLRGALGDPAGLRVAWLGRNSLAMLVMLFACQRTGAIFQPMNWRMPGAELKDLVEDGDPALFVWEEEFAAAAEVALEGAPDALAFPLSEAAAAMESAEPATSRPIDPDAPFILIHTSGSTGRSKGVLLTVGNAAWSAHNFRTLGQVSERSAMLCDAPLFHNLGLVGIVCSGMEAGAAILLSDRFLPEATLARIADPQLGVSHYFCVPQVAQMLREHPDYSPAAMAGLTALFTGGAPNPPWLIEAYLDDGVLVANGYGMSEAGTVMCMPLDAAAVRRKVSASGLKAKDVEIRIVRADGTDAPVGEAGELWLKGPAIMPGYWRRPEINAQTFVDGWLRSGDVGRVDEDGFYEIVGRLKDMYITGGENVYPAEVEAVLTGLKGIAEAAVVGYADQRWGESGCAFIVVAPEAEVSEADIRRACDERLARYKHPRRILFVDSLPRTGSGKVRKEVLRESLAGAGDKA